MSESETVPDKIPQTWVGVRDLNAFKFNIKFRTTETPHSLTRQLVWGVTKYSDTYFSGSTRSLMGNAGAAAGLR